MKVRHLVASAGFALATTLAAAPAFAGTNGTPPPQPNGHATVYNDWGSKTCASVGRFGPNPWVDLCLPRGASNGTVYSYGNPSGYTTCFEQFTGSGWVGAPTMRMVGYGSRNLPAYSTWSARVLLGNAVCPTHW